MLDADHIQPDPVRIMATPRQMRDRLDILIALLHSGSAMPSGAMRRTADEALALSESLGAHKERLLALCAIAECDLSEELPAKAYAVLHDALAVGEELDLPEVTARTLLLMARAHAALHSVADSHVALVRARDLYRALGDSRGAVQAAVALGNLYVSVGDLVRGVECFNEALVECATFVSGQEPPGSEAPGDLVQLGAVYNDLAHAHSILGDEERAIDLTARALELFERGGDIRLQALALTALGTLQASSGDADAGLDSSMRAVLLMDALHDRPGTTRTMMTIASIHERSGRRTEAIGTMEKALALAESATPALLAAALVGMAGLQRRGGRLWQAAAQLERAIGMLSEQGEQQLLYHAHELLAGVYEDLGAADRALDHYKAFMVLHDTLRGQERQRAIAELEVRFALAGAERDRELYRLQAEHLRGELESKTREMVSITSGMLQKNSVLELLLDRMRQRFAERPELRHALAVLREEIDRLRDPADAWSAIEAGLGGLYTAFVGTLAERYPGLSPTEVKLCVLLRADMMSRDIAALLYISERTVENHRYRLRRKMNLSPNANLTSYLKSL